jgi:short-subunit dehydrogenase
MKKRKGIIVGASSDIGVSLSEHFFKKQFELVGTFRVLSNELKELENSFVNLIQADFSENIFVDECIKQVQDIDFSWDFLIFCTGTMEPIGRFESNNFDDWERSIKVNLLSPLRFMHGILPLRSKISKKLPTVIFFAGGGTNSAPINFSAYTLSKIALIKAVELLDAEHGDICFTILGPGWVKTKIHSETLRAAKTSEKAYEETKARFESNNFIPMQKIIDCCEWLLKSSKDVIGGRNFSAAHDQWNEEYLVTTLKENPDMYKLRRNGNDWCK